MLKSELKAQIAMKMTHLSEKIINDAVDVIVLTMTNALLSGQSIEIRNFAKFGLRNTAPRQAHNPKTGERVLSDASQKVYFRAGKGLRERINKAAGY